MDGWKENKWGYNEDPLGRDPSWSPTSLGHYSDPSDDAIYRDGIIRHPKVRTCFHERLSLINA